MDEEEREAVIRYRTHDSANKEADLFQVEMAKHVQAGNVSVFPLDAVIALQKLCLSPVSVISQVGRMSRLIFDFT